jgi:hypothetical protein
MFLSYLSHKNNLFFEWKIILYIKHNKNKRTFTTLHKNNDYVFTLTRVFRLKNMEKKGDNHFGSFDVDQETPDDSV